MYTEDKYNIVLNIAWFYVPKHVERLKTVAKELGIDDEKEWELKII